jgi:hypothetical protein
MSVSQLRLSALLAGTLWSAAVLYGQGSLGSISGRITDTSGGVLAGASVTLTNTGTDQHKTAVSSAAGYYIFPDVAPGAYTIKAQLKGFQSSVTSGIGLQVGQTLTNDIQMAVGEVTSSVEVKAAAEQLQRESASTGQVITTEQVLNMPLNGRNFLALSLLAPGASENPGAQSQFSINGMRGNQTSILFDGVDSRMFQNGRPALTPSIDALQEFKIQQNSNSAAYGNGAAIINSALRSGTNAIHGAAWEFLRNDALDAKGFFDKVKPALRRNQFGFTVGGPIRHNKTFFFFNYEGLRTRQTVTQYAFVPTPAQLSGNFSGGAAIYDPATINAANQRLPFANNAIPTSRIGVFAQAASKYYPAPNLTGVPGYNYVAGVSLPENAKQFNVRVDHQFSAADSLFVRASRSTDESVGYSFPLPYSGTTSQVNGTQVVLRETHIFSPNLLNEFTLGYTYGLNATYDQLAPNAIAIDQFKLANLRIPAFEQGLPLLSITGYSAMGSPINEPFGGTENYYQLSDDVTYARNRNQLKAGFEIRQFRPSMYDQQTANGNLGFNGQFTNQPGVSGAGSAVADFVLNAPYTASATQLVNSSGQLTLRWNHYAFYVQDDYKLTPKITLNLGLRYEYDSPFKAVYGDAYTWDVTNHVFLVPGKSIGSLTKPDRNNFAPRFGIAYSVAPRTVVRAGFGVFYGFIRGLELSSGYHLDPPFVVSTTVNSAALTPTIGSGVFLPAPTGSAPTATTNLFSVDNNLPANYTYQWNVAVQRQLSDTMSLQVAYVGSSSHKLIGRTLVNQAVVDANPLQPTAIQNRRPYPGAGDISMTEAIDNANYNALQATAEKRLSKGLTFLASYTWSKALGIAEAGDQSAIGDQYVPRHNYYGPTPYDQPQRLTLSGTYELPFGTGKQFASTISPIANKFIGGWNVTGIGTFFRGEYATPTSNISANVGRVDRNVPNCISNPNLSGNARTVQRWFNTAAIAGQPFGTFGNCGVGVIEIPGESNVDLAVIKDTRVGERLKVELRSEFFNFFNHPSFGAPNVTLGSASFGVITSTRTTSRQIQFGLKLYW